MTAGKTSAIGFGPTLDVLALRGGLESGPRRTRQPTRRVPHERTGGTSMDREQLVKRLMATFLEELQEQVQALNRDLLALKKDPQGAERDELLKQLFRTAHSLKGAARSVNVRPIEDACHHLEELLSGVRDGSRTASADFFELLLQSADAIEEAGMRLQEEQDFAGSPLDCSTSAARGGCRGRTDEARTAAPIRTPSPERWAAPSARSGGETPASPESTRSPPPVPVAVEPPPQRGARDVAHRRREARYASGQQWRIACGPATCASASRRAGGIAGQRQSLAGRMAGSGKTTDQTHRGGWRRQRRPSVTATVMARHCRAGCAWRCKGWETGYVRWRRTWSS